MNPKENSDVIWEHHTSLTKKNNAENSRIFVESGHKSRSHIDLNNNTCEQKSHKIHPC